jgi:hypothetical protein
VEILIDGRRDDQAFVLSIRAVDLAGNEAIANG